MSFNSELDLKVSRIIKAPRDIVWQAWANPEHFVKWWAPAPVVTTSQAHELFPGGAFNTTMVLEDGTTFAGKGCFLDVEQQARIVFTDALQGGWRPNSEPFFTAVITLEDHPEGTRYTAVAMHVSAEACERHAAMGFADGWGTALSQLAALAEQLATA
jgi:uncharacterized protein YndB with AHSA1/START domain